MMYLVIQVVTSPFMLPALFSKGIVFLSLTKAVLTAWTLRRSLAFLFSTTWTGLSACGTCLYPDLFLSH